MKKISIAIIGASGLVGEKIIEIMEEQNLLKNVDLTLYVSEKSANESIFIQGQKFKYLLLNKSNIKKAFNIVFFSAGEEVSRTWAKYFVKKGAYVIDNSNAFRREISIPLVVPEINSEIIKRDTKIISNPNCSTIQLAIAINALKDLAKIEKIVVSTYQSVSGAGKNALEDLNKGTNFEIKEGIKDNVIVKIGKIDKNNFCTEENKIMFELNKILKSNFSVCASTVRVPVPFCHTESVYIKFNKNVELNNIINQMLQSKLIIDKLSLPTEVANTNETHICRLRKFSDSEIVFFVIADNLRRGAAYNAVMIAKIIIDKFFTI